MREIVEKDLGHLLITSSSSYFLNKSDFEKYLFKAYGIKMSYMQNYPSIKGYPIPGIKFSKLFSRLHCLNDSKF